MKNNILLAQKLFQNPNKDLKVDSTSLLYDLIVRKLPSQIRDVIKNEDLRVKGSIGQGNITTHPWISILNPEITTTTQEGLYVVILFNASFTSFYLSLHQGITYFENKYKRRRYEFAKKVANYFREEITKDEHYSFDEINLEAQRGSLGYGYEQTNIVSKKFDIQDFSEKELKKSIKQFVDLYDEIKAHMFPGKNYNELVDSILFTEEDVYISAEEQIKKIEEVLKNETRIPHGAKQKLIMMSAGKERSKKYKKISSPIITKTDWIKKAKDDAITGNIGEKLILEYEIDRLTKLGLVDEAEKVKSVAIISDAFGYDILSFDQDEKGNIFELY
ncbi:MAG: DUF3578 domain-containing protein, partial [Bacilli bacterium]|nr:DUF3578 domain-containing protein [Bacilli bacterium]